MISMEIKCGGHVIKLPVDLLDVSSEVAQPEVNRPSYISVIRAVRLLKHWTSVAIVQRIEKEFSWDISTTLSFAL